MQAIRKSAKLLKAHSPNSKVQKETQEHGGAANEGAEARTKQRKSPKKAKGDTSIAPAACFVLLNNSQEGKLVSAGALISSGG
jgi:hypothetical protein